MINPSCPAPTLSSTDRPLPHKGATLIDAKGMLPGECIASLNVNSGLAEGWAEPGSTEEAEKHAETDTGKCA